MQSLAPEPRVEPDAGTDTGPRGLSSIQQDAVQSIIRQCLEARDEHARLKCHYTARPDGSDARECLMVATGMIGFLGGTIEGILADCRRLT